jgi:hypothetical protein
VIQATLDITINEYHTESLLREVKVACLVLDWLSINHFYNEQHIHIARRVQNHAKRITLFKKTNSQKRMSYLRLLHTLRISRERIVYIDYNISKWMDRTEPS